MLYITRQGEVYAGSQRPGSFLIDIPPSKDYKLKDNWHEVIPAVWEYDIAGAKARLTKEIFSKCDEKLNLILSQWPKNEIDSWGNQASQAVEWSLLTEEQKSNSQNNSRFNLIFNIATGKDSITTSEDFAAVELLVSRILTNKQAYESYTGKILNTKRILKKQVDAATTEEEINSINIVFP